MLQSRKIVSLLIHKNELVKSKKFGSFTYLGDPLNAVKIFSEKKADELVLFDIDATVNKFDVNYQLIEKIASECRMPLCYGGGIKTAEHAKKIISLGVEKISISSVIHENIKIIGSIATLIGCQSVVITLDVKQICAENKIEYRIYTHNGKCETKLELFDCIKRVIDAGAGEIIINCIDRDGMMTGYDLYLASLLKAKLTIPFVLLGGAGSYSDIDELITQHGVIGAAAGSAFVFTGPNQAVLINYPNNN